MRQLKWVCAGESVLPRYEHFVRSLNPDELVIDDEPDAVDWMRTYLGGIEHAERQFHDTPQREPMKVP